MRALRILTIAFVALFLSVPTAQAAPSQTVTYTAEQWAGLPKLVAWYETTASWTLADWWDWGIMSSSLHDNDLARAGDRAAIQQVIWRVWGPAAPWAFRIVQRESGFDPNATNRSSGACGLFQMLGHEDMFIAAGNGGQCHDAVANVEVAHQLYLGSGTAPWRL